MTNKLHIHKYSWGETLWAYIHTICIVYGLEKDVEIESNKIIQLLYNLHNIIPCKYCADHYKKLITEYPPDNCIKTMDLFKWSVHIHNHINKYLGKPQLTYEDALQLWTIEIQVDK